MGWSSAAWLAGAAAIIIPILLHLRDRHPPELIRVGSVADLAPAAAVQRRRRFDDIPLLLLRCLVIILAAVLMAGPQLDDGSGTPGARIVVAVPGDAQADSLVASGTPRVALPASPRPWTLAAWADTTVGRNDTLMLASPDAALHVGIRPVLTHVAVPVGPTPPGMVPAHRTPRTELDGGVPTRRRDRSAAVWWLLLAAIAVERVVASRGRA